MHVGQILMIRVPDDLGAREGPAIVTQVWCENCVDMLVMLPRELPSVRSSVHVVSSQREARSEDYATWITAWPIG